MVRRVHGDPGGLRAALPPGHRAAQHVLHLQTLHGHLLRLRVRREDARTAADPPLDSPHRPGLSSEWDSAEGKLTSWAENTERESDEEEGREEIH